MRESYVSPNGTAKANTNAKVGSSAWEWGGGRPIAFRYGKRDDFTHGGSVPIGVLQYGRGTVWRPTRQRYWTRQTHMSVRQ
jgi:hypothetical protein